MKALARRISGASSSPACVAAPKDGQADSWAGSTGAVAVHPPDWLALGDTNWAHIFQLLAAEKPSEVSIEKIQTPGHGGARAPS